MTPVVADYNIFSLDITQNTHCICLLTNVGMGSAIEPAAREFIQYLFLESANKIYRTIKRLIIE
jgi:hypothetical protein